MVTHVEDYLIGRRKYSIFSLLELLFHPLKLRPLSLKMVDGFETPPPPPEFDLNSFTYMWEISERLLTF